jgi:hypothetical protein
MCSCCSLLIQDTLKQSESHLEICSCSFCGFQDVSAPLVRGVLSLHEDIKTVNLQQLLLLQFKLGSSDLYSAALWEYCSSTGSSATTVDPGTSSTSSTTSPNRKKPRLEAMPPPQRPSEVNNNVVSFHSLSRESINQRLSCFREGVTTMALEMDRQKMVPIPLHSFTATDLHMLSALYDEPDKSKAVRDILSHAAQYVHERVHILQKLEGLRRHERSMVRLKEVVSRGRDPSQMQCMLRHLNHQESVLRKSFEGTANQWHNFLYEISTELIGLYHDLWSLLSSPYPVFPSAATDWRRSDSNNDVHDHGASVIHSVHKYECDVSRAVEKVKLWRKMYRECSHMVLEL